MQYAATGDPLQNPPIESLALGAVDAAELYHDAISSLFSSQLTLQKCKRVANAAQAETLRTIKRRLFDLKDSPLDVLRAYAKPIKNLA